MLSRSLALCALVAVSAVASAQKVTLRFKPPVGKSYNFAMATDSSSKGTGQNANSKQTSDGTLKVISRTGPKTKVLLTSKNTKISGQTAKGMTPAQIKEAEKKGNDSIDLTIGDLGRVLSIDGKTAQTKGMAQMGSEVLSVLGPFPSFSQAAVGAGSKWTSSIDFNKMMGGAMPMMKVTGGTIPLNLKLVKFVDRGGKHLAQIDMNGTGNMSLSMTPPKGMTARPQAFSVKIAVNLKASYFIDVTTGISSESSTTLALDINMGGQGKVNQTMKVSFKQK